MADARTRESEVKPESIWLTRCQLAYDQSTSFINNNFRTKWEKNLNNWQSKHHRGSKYNSTAYLYRSKNFRPKTRAAIRAKEAAAVAAFFSNVDAVSVTAFNDNDRMQQASAEINQELFQYRLEKTIPWFLTCIGAFQDACVTGVCVSYQDWKFEEKEVTREYELIDPETGNAVLDGETGEPYIEREKVSEIVKDEPSIDLFPVENLRLHPNADWRDPVNSSPYLIRLIPMWVGDVKARMGQDPGKTGRQKWKNLTDEEISSALKYLYDSTRMTRDENREDRVDTQNSPIARDFDVVWVHHNFMRIDSVDYVFFTLGTEYLLTDPTPIEEVYWHLRPGERPFTMGYSLIETHKNFPNGIADLGQNIQIEMNDNAAQRSDNVKLVLNKRWFVKKGRQVDISSITRNVAGSVTMLEDPDKDVREVNFPDVTSSAYMEQDRYNADFDELVGAFSPGSVQTNRRLNETVGGMNLVKQGANSLTEYDIKTFTETWVEKTLSQVLRLEQFYESDTTLIALAAERISLYQNYGINGVTDELLTQELTCRVNVGMGATDPIMKVNGFLFALKNMAQTMQIASQIPQMQNMDWDEIRKEIFSRVGYADGERFFVSEDEEGAIEQIDPMLVQQLMQQFELLKQQNAALTQQLQDKDMDRRTKMLMAQLKEDGQDRRKGAELRTRLTEKQLDLRNPVVGEKI